MVIKVETARSAGDTILSAGEWSARSGNHRMHGYWSTVSVKDDGEWKHKQNAYTLDPPPAK
jgi:hypothetical protein